MKRQSSIGNKCVSTPIKLPAQTKVALVGFRGDEPRGGGEGWQPLI